MKVSKITKYLAKKCKLGVDLDRPSQFELLKTYFNARFITGNVKNVKVFRTGKGYHIKIDVPTNVFHRAGLGDDRDRLYLSELRGGDDVLFDYKESRGWTEELDDDWILRLPFWWMPRRKPKSIYRRRR